MKFTINNGGDAPGTFESAGFDAHKALNDLQRALTEMQSTVHGRNYQCNREAQQDYENDRDTLARAWTHYRALTDIVGDYRITAAKQRS